MYINVPTKIITLWLFSGSMLIYQRVNPINVPKRSKCHDGRTTGPASEASRHSSPFVSNLREQGFHKDINSSTYIIYNFIYIYNIQYIYIYYMYQRLAKKKYMKDIEGHIKKYHVFPENRVPQI